MAISAPVNIGSSATVTSGVTTITTTADCPAGAKILVAGAAGFFSPSSSHISSVTDSDSNSYAVDAQDNSGSNAGSSIASADNPSDLPSGSTITVTWDNASAAARQTYVYYVTGLATGHAVTTAIGTGTGTAQPTTAASAAVSGNVLDFSVTAFNGAVTGTAGSGYTLLDAVNASKSAMTEYQIATGLSSATQTATDGNTAPGQLWSICLAVYQGAAAVAALHELAMLGVGL